MEARGFYPGKNLWPFWETLLWIEDALILEMKNLPLFHSKFITSAIKLIKSGENVSVFISQKAVFTSLSDSVIFWSWFIVKQYLGLLLNIGINTKDSAFSIFKTARRKYMSLKTLRCLSLSAKGQHWNFVIYFFHFYLLFFFLILYLFFHWKYYHVFCRVPA